MNAILPIHSLESSVYFIKSLLHTLHYLYIYVLNAFLLDRQRSTPMNLLHLARDKVKLSFPDIRWEELKVRLQLVEKSLKN